MQYKKLTLNIENDKHLFPLFLTLIELIPEIPVLDKLIDEATVDGPITIDFVSLSESQTGGHFEQRGEIFGHQRRIERFIKVVSEGESFADMMYTLVFELCNAKNPAFQLFSDSAIRPEDFNDSESYAFMTEAAEYSDTYVPARKILTKMFTDSRVLALFRDNGIELSISDIRNLTTDSFRDFEHWWAHTNQKSPYASFSHADTYRQQFERYVGNSYPNRNRRRSEPRSNDSQAAEIIVEEELSQEEILKLIKAQNRRH